MVQTEDSKITSEGNNSTTVPYPVPFYFLNNSEIIVVVKDSAGLEQHLVLNTDYTVTGAGNPTGGSIKTTQPVSTASTVTRFRELPVTQLTSYEEGDAFPAKSHEKALDKLTMLIQQVMRATGGLESELEGDRARAFRLTEASGGIKALSKITDSTLGIDTAGESVLRTPVEMLAWLGQVGTFWHDAAERAHTRGAFPGQTGVQTDNWTLYIAHSTEPGNWVPFLSSSGIVISTNGTPSAKFNPSGDIVGTSESQVLSNKTLNAPTINNPTGLTPANVGLDQADNTSDANKPVSTPTVFALQSKQDLAQKANPNGYASLDSVGKVPIEQIPSSLIGGNSSFQTSWNASANIPPILSGSASAANNGFFYLVSVAGTTVVDSVTSWAVGDMCISDGTKWVKIIATAAVSSVAGKIGAVTLVKGDVGLGNVDNTSVAVQNAAAATLTNKVINGAS